MHKKGLLSALMFVSLLPVVSAQSVFSGALDILFGASEADAVFVKFGLFLVLLSFLTIGLKKAHFVPEGHEKLGTLVSIIIAILAMKFMPASWVMGLGKAIWIIAVAVLPYAVVSMFIKTEGKKKWFFVIAAYAIVIFSVAQIGKFPNFIGYIGFGNETIEDIWYFLNANWWIPFIAALAFILFKAINKLRGSGGGKAEDMQRTAKVQAKAETKNIKLQDKLAQKAEDRQRKQFEAQEKNQRKAEENERKRQEKQQAKIAELERKKSEAEQKSAEAPTEKAPGFFKRWRIGRQARRLARLKKQEEERIKKETEQVWKEREAEIQQTNRKMKTKAQFAEQRAKWNMEKEKETELRSRESEKEVSWIKREQALKERKQQETDQMYREREAEKTKHLQAERKVIAHGTEAEIAEHEKEREEERKSDIERRLQIERERKMLREKEKGEAERKKQEEAERAREAEIKYRAKVEAQNEKAAKKKEALEKKQEEARARQERKMIAQKKAAAEAKAKKAANKSYEGPQGFRLTKKRW